MPSSESQTTRLLCASAILLGSRYRREVLGYLENEARGVSPELGLDLGLVARVCQFAENREKAFQIYLFIALICGLLLAAVIQVLGIALYVTAAFLIFFRKVYVERFTFLNSFRRENFRGVDVERTFPAELAPEVLSALPAEDQNLVVYRGFNPFAGAGTDLGGWSFAVDLSKSSEEFGIRATPRPFKIDEVYRVIGEKIATAGFEALVAIDYYFVKGTEVRGDPTILPDNFGRPVQRIEVGREAWYATGHDERVRRYKWIRVHDWGQELVMSYLLRCSLRGSTMFVEINRHVLTPLAEKYRGVDKLPELRFRHAAVLLAESLVAGPLYGAASPLLLLGRLSEGLDEAFGGKERRRRWEIEENPRFDYGAGQGVRQACSSNLFAHYFQKADADFYTKVLERSVLAAIVTFLENHSIDTSDLRERQTMILNSGIIVQGGDVNAESLAVGQGAQAIKNQRPSKPLAKGAGA